LLNPRLEDSKGCAPSVDRIAHDGLPDRKLLNVGSKSCRFCLLSRWPGPPSPMSKSYLTTATPLHSVAAISTVRDQGAITIPTPLKDGPPESKTKLGIWRLRTHGRPIKIP